MRAPDREVVAGRHVHDRYLEMHVADDGPVAVVRARGELDVVTAPTLAGVLAGLVGPRAVRIDAAGLTFVDVRGLHVLHSAHEALRRAGGSLVVLHPPHVLRLLASVVPIGLALLDDPPEHGPAVLASLADRDVVEQAVGYLAASRGLDLVAARAALLSEAAQAGRPPAEHARTVLPAR